MWTANTTRLDRIGALNWCIIWGPLGFLLRGCRGPFSRQQTGQSVKQTGQSMKLTTHNPLLLSLRTSEAVLLPPHAFINPKCSRDKEQTVDHIICSCNLQEQERDRLKAVITRSEQWPISKNKLVLKYYKNFKQFTDSIVLNKEKCNK